MLALVCMVALCVCATNASLAELRQKVCGSNTDCVKVVGGTGNIMVDELDFTHDTVDSIRQKLPSWFGPARPIQFLFKEQIVREDAKLAELGILIGGVMKIISAPRDGLDL